MEFIEKNNSFLNILKGVAISIIFTAICLFIFSCLLVYTNISESLMQPVIIVITGVSILLGSSMGNRKATKNGILKGALVGGIYILLIYLFSSIASEINFALNVQSVIMVFVGMLCGIVGGIIGVNM
ncbi:MAG: TIGR04086 family membrane protein [Clostridia bacterium]|nr:TIGR04086 family membrane protein [Clostridia bacterium]